MELLGHTNAVLSVKFHPTENILASGSADCSVKMWDGTSGEELRELKGHTDNINEVVFDPSKPTVLFSGSDDGLIKAWDWVQGSLLFELVGHEYGVWSVDISPDGHLVVSGSLDGTARLWDLINNSCEVLQLGHDVLSVKFLDKTNQILVAGVGLTQIIDLETKNVRVEFVEQEGEVNSAVMSPDGKWVATGAELQNNEESVKLWDAQEGKLVKILPENNCVVTEVLFHPSGEYLVGGMWDNTAKVWRIPSGEIVHKFVGHRDFVHTVALNKAVNKLAVGSGDGRVHMWDFPSP